MSVETLEKVESKSEIENRLIKQNIGLLYFCLRKYRKYSNYEDLKQEVLIAMLQGIRAYNPTKARISTFLTMRIKYRIRNYFRDQQNRPDRQCLTACSLDKPMMDGGGNLHDIVPEKRQCSIPELTEEKILYDKILSCPKLSTRESEILRMYSEGYRFHEIGPAHGISTERARQIYNRAVQKVRLYLRAECWL